MQPITLWQQQGQTVNLNWMSFFGRSFRGYHHWNGLPSPGLSVTNHANNCAIQSHQNLPGLSHELPAPGSPIHRLCRQWRWPRTVAAEFISSVHRILHEISVYLLYILVYMMQRCAVNTPLLTLLKLIILEGLENKIKQVDLLLISIRFSYKRNSSKKYEVFRFVVL